MRQTFGTDGIEVFFKLSCKDVINAEDLEVYGSKS